MIFSLSLSLETLSSDTSDVSASVGGRNEYGRIHINMAAASGSFRALIITRTVLEPCRARPCLFFFWFASISIGNVLYSATEY